MGFDSKLIGMMMIWVLFLQSCAWEEQRKIFGEECLTSSECNEKELLSCQNGLCTCSPFVSLFYDENIQKCVARVGEKCGLSHRGDTAVTIPCVEGAICDESIGGGCVCTDDYFRIANGTCLKKRKYLESCRADFECSKDVKTSKPLVCSDKNICVCNPLTQYYDNERRQCVTLVGYECKTELANYINECTNHSTCINGICECQEHFARTKSGRCGLGHGEPCTGSENRGNETTCSDLQFVCLNGKCDCRYPLHQFYDTKKKECLSLISGPCTILPEHMTTTTETNYVLIGGASKSSESTDNGNDDDDDESNSIPQSSILTTTTMTTAAAVAVNEPLLALASTNSMIPPLPPQKCTKHAICIDHGFFQSCECEDGYVQTKAGTCAPGYDAPCEIDECDPITPLFCRNGKCKCLDELQVFDASMRKCVGLVGSRCDLKKEYQCVEFCSCIQIGLSLEGKCLCDKYSQEISNRTCVYNYTINSSQETTVISNGSNQQSAMEKYSFDIACSININYIHVKQLLDNFKISLEILLLR